MKKTIEVSVMGQKLQIRSDTDDHYVERVAHLVDENMAEVMRNTKSVASLNVAILAAMNMMDKHLKEKENKDQKFRVLEKKIQELIELIDLQL